MGYQLVSVDAWNIGDVTSLNNGIPRSSPPIRYVEKGGELMQPKCECHPRCRCGGLGVTNCGCKWNPLNQDLLFDIDLES